MKLQKLYSKVRQALDAVSYTHLDVYKRQDMDAPAIIRLLYNKDICKCSSCGGKIIPLPTEQHFIKPKPHMLC